mmetsp:Transcript_1183/g.3055  ORF Transcript_1183/g.3055 Transcript_1183/m.3055 type:complete len:275 (-) Transcript_1183:79-903(-)|eukprot:CAMPEP_0116834072 /NCGR_PEP_ID=MMETSP0418-20121206/6789_1 /TAXON_ID=1158023 /ORGANISM="Astrosyne radiata, Strain 13vi08-1A" /LENGTH=274 /DNA_ID=CAMNT_0004463593 /DNA_START=1478 /DNA_END=2302 /DNA_ORIENTATION=-
MPIFPVNENTVAFVTGANRPNGIGRAIVNGLLQKNVKKVYATGRDIKPLEELVDTSNGRLVPVELDVTDNEQVANLGKLYPDVNLVVNNAGFAGLSDALGDQQMARREMEVNYFGPLAIVHAFQEVLKGTDQSMSDENKNKNEKGSAVVNVNSIASFVNFPVSATYSASKAASHSLTQAQRRELCDSTVVVGVYPGPIDTDMADGLEMDKSPTSLVVDAMIDALETGEVEDVFPDGMSQQVHAGWQADAKAMEQQMTESTKQKDATDDESSSSN